MSPELLGVLKEKGFAEVRLEDHDILEQANLFYNAEMIVANHGAALANMIFADVRKTRILELNSGFNPTCFTRIHNQLALMLNVNPSRFNILFEDAIAERAITRSGGMGNYEWHTRFKHNKAVERTVPLCRQMLFHSKSGRLPATEAKELRNGFGRLQATHRRIRAIRTMKA